ncbi:MAG TPA: BON domain-containing protein [Opitutaceae bacterium]|jgi:osmotically-inducible protein OsmY
MNLPKYSPIAAAILAAAVLAAPAALRADNDGQLSDHDIKKDVIKNMPSQISDKVSVSVDNGVVTLSGTVISDAQKSWAESAAKQVPQVRDVNDQLQVQEDATASASADKPHSDHWIAMKVKSELMFHKNVSATHTDVVCLDGVVTLSGVADNEAQRELTAEYAKRVDGVRDVRNQIQIRGSESNQTFAGDQSRSNGTKVDDSTITTKVKWELATHKSTSAIDTHVKTENGVVFISGSAKNDAEKSLVTQLAQGVQGVNEVDNQMSIQNQ